MSGKFQGQVVLITGGARGQGRSHALAFAQAGADIVFCDVPRTIETVSYPVADRDDLEETARLVEATGRRCIAVEADVRDRGALEDLAATAVDELGRIDVLCANAAIAAFGSIADSSQELWDDVMACNLTGVWNSIKAVLPSMLERRYGRVIVTSSSVARHPVPNQGPYIASKAGVLGLVKVLSMEHFHDGITANAIAPSIVRTKMVLNDASYRLFVPDVEQPTEAEVLEAWQRVAPYGDATLEPETITDGVMFLASPAASKISGICLDIQAGWNAETPV